MKLMFPLLICIYRNFIYMATHIWKKNRDLLLKAKKGILILDCRMKKELVASCWLSTNQLRNKANGKQRSVKTSKRLNKILLMILIQILSMLILFYQCIFLNSEKLSVWFSKISFQSSTWSYKRTKKEMLSVLFQEMKSSNKWPRKTKYSSQLFLSLVLFQHTVVWFMHSCVELMVKMLMISSF